jgi:hypothetical protein
MYVKINVFGTNKLKFLNFSNLHLKFCRNGNIISMEFIIFTKAEGELIC